MRLSTTPGCGGSHHRDEADYRIRVRYHRIREGRHPLSSHTDKDNQHFKLYTHVTDYSKRLQTDAYAGNDRASDSDVKNQLPGETVESVEPAPRNRPFIRSLGNRHQRRPERGGTRRQFPHPLHGRTAGRSRPLARQMETDETGGLSYPCRLRTLYRHECHPRRRRPRQSSLAVCRPVGLGKNHPPGRPQPGLPETYRTLHLHATERNRGDGLQPVSSHHSFPAGQHHLHPCGRITKDVSGHPSP